MAKKIPCNKITTKTVKTWFKYLEAFWIFNIIGEAMPQLIIRSVLLLTIIIEGEQKNGALTFLSLKAISARPECFKL